MFDQAGNRLKQFPIGSGNNLSVKIFWSIDFSDIKQLTDIKSQKLFSNLFDDQIPVSRTIKSYLNFGIQLPYIRII